MLNAFNVLHFMPRPTPDQTQLRHTAVSGKTRKQRPTAPKVSINGKVEGQWIVILTEFL
jgi:hypothetical protein